MSVIRTFRRPVGILLAGAVAPHLIATGVAIALIAIAVALWQGARPHVVAFGGDACFAALGAFRRRLGLPPERPPDTQPPPDVR
jgi:EamA domain-containing membrane protein RarD